MTGAEAPDKFQEILDEHSEEFTITLTITPFQYIHLTTALKSDLKRAQEAREVGAAREEDVEVAEEVFAGVIEQTPDELKEQSDTLARRIVDATDPEDWSGDNGDGDKRDGDEDEGDGFVSIDL